MYKYGKDVGATGFTRTDGTDTYLICVTITVESCDVVCAENKYDAVSDATSTAGKGGLWAAPHFCSVDDDT